MLVAVGAVATLAFIGLHLTPPLSLPRVGDGLLLALTLWSGLLMTWRAADERNGRRQAAQALADWQGIGRRFLARVQAFIVPGSDDEAPESDELKSTLTRRHAAIDAAQTALREGRVPANEAGVIDNSTPLERLDLHGEDLVERLVNLQRDALVEAERRHWLGAARFTALEQDLAHITHSPAPVKTWTSGYTRLTSLTVSVTAVMLPLAASVRTSGIVVGAFIGALLVAFDALSD